MRNLAAGMALTVVLFSSTGVWSCPQCRPAVKAEVYDGDFVSNLLMLLLPLAILFLIGIALHFSDAIISWLHKPKGTISWQNNHNAAP